MNIWHDINPDRITPNDFMAVIEIEKGSKKKYELDKQTGLIVLDRILYTSTHYRQLRIYPAHPRGRRRPAGRTGTLQRTYRPAGAGSVLPHRSYHNA